ncbi:MAG: SusE domain-containing protein [Muribaculaceae bacterium]|nr:SusE domain-containing protein [Muribaculaceae bacterium]MDE6753712.1 SusE domain-containing protein [Muribaculaceae bacterium]
MAAACAVFGMASCSQDRDPVLQKPTEFVLNVPAMQDQYIELTEGNILELVSSQPNYGYSAVANYSAQMSLTEDFASYETVEPIDAHQARMSLKQADIATALCVLHGIESEEAFSTAYPDGVMPYEKVYFRAVCELAGVEGTSITSNVVAYNNIQGYFAVPVPGYIYLVGNPEGWAGPTESNAAHYADWRLFEPNDAIGSHVYIGTFNLPAAPMFRFYTQLTGWDADSYGYQEADEATDFPDVTSDFNGVLVKGKGAFNFPNLPEGEYTIVVDMSDMKNITFSLSPAGSGPVVVTKYIYMMGTLPGWNEPSPANEEAYKNFRLADRTGDGIYIGTFTVPAGDWYVRFVSELTDAGWDTPQWGAAEEDGNNVEASFTNGTYSSPYVVGKGCWFFNLADDTSVSISLDTNNNTVEFVTE